jgi:hypothetical protein
MKIFGHFLSPYCINIISFWYCNWDSNSNSRPLPQWLEHGGLCVSGDVLSYFKVPKRSLDASKKQKKYEYVRLISLWFNRNNYANFRACKFLILRIWGGRQFKKLLKFEYLNTLSVNSYFFLQWNYCFLVPQTLLNTTPCVPPLWMNLLYC